MNKHTMIDRFSVLSALLGLALLLGVILSGAAYPHPLFQIGAPVGLLFVFVSVALQFISWILEICHGVKEKQYRFVIVIVLLGLLVICLFLSGL